MLNGGKKENKWRAVCSFILNKCLIAKQTNKQTAVSDKRFNLTARTHIFPPIVERFYNTNCGQKKNINRKQK